jgi:hypothetical protein
LYAATALSYCINGRYARARSARSPYHLGWRFTAMEYCLIASLNRQRL